MEKLKLSEIAPYLGATYNKDAEFDSVCIDTRKITKGCLFICIKGERFDAHQFADEALSLGASAVMIHFDIEPNGAYIKVDDTAKAMLRLSGYYRSKFDIPVIGLTGSVGKTTTKEFTHLVVSAKYNAIKTLGNLNNEIGVPQMLFQIDNSTEAAVIEMGMNHFGEISRLVNEVEPTIGLITNIGVSHIENLGSREGILKAKLELCEGLAEGAPLILNGDNDMLQTVKDEHHKVVFYGIENGEFKAENIVEADDSTSFDVAYYGKKQHITIPTIGIHNVYNALAAFVVGYFLHIDPQLSADALADYVPAGMRQKVVDVDGITSIEDCYNASPDSMRAALKTLSDIKGNKKIAVLGDMLELGDYAKTAHTEVGNAVAENKIEYLLAYGNDAKFYVDGAKQGGVKNAFLFDDKEKLSEMLLNIASKGDAVLFKGSRGMKLEDVINTVYKGWRKQ
ncbi:MAG: UDP-N-acetylmuramoyl-tripeptide--D-alanyl-D-alanine ligase [Eubacterium coprostanoligenes]|uniref:UDP-N-acetylmuramoyl-tripeptide--D-alanyl-D- alanine ligase n=1 Tax=Eubacterium coprostanoligenes TaxID=290054 RepID=UPI00240A4E7B|nr:UDP-N-acetylmuramoyl-tripeptide--D-alanyl-D-alanine ligase [Eubacterium coprostanoligenes]MDD6665542.1 UDP-N-acetylmuramoyl-tripeptide--D-alanyl-D-alanine ligase [Eubacterium coprostanoligenes]